MTKTKGFTLIELMVVIVISAIVATAGAAGVGHFVPGFQKRACERERAQAVRAYVSDWLSTRTLAEGGDEASYNTYAADWLSTYLNKTTVNCAHAADKWQIAVKPAEDGVSGFVVTITCPVHQGEPASATFGLRQDSSGGIPWDGGLETTAP